MVTKLVSPRYTNKIQQDFAGCLRQALVDCFGVDDIICPVLYTGQPIPQTARRCVTFSKLNSHRLGIQGRRLITDCEPYSGFAEVEHWVDEITFQVNARCKETVKDDAYTPVARDIADGLVTWFNSAVGGDYMRTVKIYPLRVADARNLTSTDESDLFQSIASFDITVQIGQANCIRELESETHRLKGIVGVPLVSSGEESGESV